MNKTKQITNGFIKESKIILPIFYIAILLSVVIDIYVPNSLIQTLFADNWLISIPIIALLAIVLPLPRYADYPIAFALLMNGAGYGVVFILLSAESLGDLLRNLTEMKYFGKKFTYLRIILSFIFLTLGAYLLEVIL